MGRVKQVETGQAQCLSRPFFSSRLVAELSRSNWLFACLCQETPTRLSDLPYPIPPVITRFLSRWPCIPERSFLEVQVEVQVTVVMISMLIKSVKCVTGLTSIWHKWECLVE